MDESRSFQRLAAITAILSAPIGLVSIVLLAAAVGFDMEAIGNLRNYLESGAQGAATYRWAMILDMVGYYLLIVPLVLCLRYWLKPRAPAQVHLFSACLLAYSLIGALGAAGLAAVVPPLIRAYAAGLAQKATIEVVFDAFTNAVYVGWWNLLEELVVGVGWVGIGLILRHERRALGMLTVVLGGASLVDAIGVILGIEALAELGLYLYLALAPLWALLLGIDLLRRPVHLEVD